MNGFATPTACHLRPFGLLMLGLLPIWNCLAQSTNASLNEDVYHWLDRYETTQGRLSTSVFTSIKPYERQSIAAYVLQLDSAGVFTSKPDRFNRDYFLNDNWEWSQAESANRSPLLKYFYKKRNDALHVHAKDFTLHVNPVGYFALGQDSNLDNPLYVNSRGIEISGTIDKRIGFYTTFFDTQARLPQYVFNGVKENLVIPHEGFWKGYEKGGVDYILARGYITFKATKHIALQFGHDRTFVGNGYRSLIFSDFGPPNLFLRSTVKIWRLNYIYQLNRLTASVEGNASGLTGNKRYPQKFFGFHHASINIGKKLNVGLFESVIFSPKDTTQTDYFDFSYLNPIIFYRAVEHQFGSSDNVILGMDFKWLVAKGISMYGQFVLDEFSFNEIKKRNGWWGNKYGIQVGAKWTNAFGIPNFDLQGEFNTARPYTYSHGTPYGNYSNYLQPLAHPAGANFKELVGIVRYQPLPRLQLTAKAFVLKTGLDGTDENWGGNILKDNTTRELNEGNKTAQGQATTILFGDFTASWMFMPNVFLDFKQVLRRSDSDLPAANLNTSITSLALRLNLAQRSYEF